MAALLGGEEIIVGTQRPYCVINTVAMQKKITIHERTLVNIRGVRAGTNTEYLTYYKLDDMFIKWGKNGVYEFRKYYGGGGNGIVYGLEKALGDGPFAGTIKLMTTDDSQDVTEEKVLIYIRAYCEHPGRGVRLPMVEGVFKNIKFEPLSILPLGWTGLLGVAGQEMYDKYVMGKIRGVITRPIEGVGEVVDLGKHLSSNTIGSMPGSQVIDGWSYYIYNFCMDVLEGLKVLHEIGYIHNDLKPANVLVSRERLTGNYKEIYGDMDVYRFTLTDFGNSVRYRLGSEHYPESRGGMPTTAVYSTLNHITGRGVSRRMDMCQFCYLLFEIVYGVTPYWFGYGRTADVYGAINDFCGRFVGDGKLSHDARFRAFMMLVECSRNIHSGNQDRYKRRLVELGMCDRVTPVPWMMHREIFGKSNMLDAMKQQLIDEGLCAIWMYCFDLGYRDTPDYEFIKDYVNDIVAVIG